MVAVIIIAVVFTGISATIFWAAPRGKLAPLSGVLLSQKRSTSLVINTALALIMVVFGVVVPAIFLVANHDRTSAGLTNGIKLTSAETSGRMLFGEHCAVCHTLAAASAVGHTGPNLDQLKPSASTTLYVLANGCLADPLPSQSNERCLGEGVMPADVVQGVDADDVAQFVAAVAGHGTGGS